MSQATSTERERLLAQLSQIVDQATTNLVILNQNIESILSLGQEFVPLAKTWRALSETWPGHVANAPAGQAPPSDSLP